MYNSKKAFVGEKESEGNTLRKKCIGKAQREGKPKVSEGTNERRREGNREQGGSRCFLPPFTLFIPRQREGKGREGCGSAKGVRREC